MVAVTLLPSMPCLMPGQSPNRSPKSCGEDGIITQSKFLGALSKTRPRRERPCDSCRRRKTRCVIQDGSATCALCENLKQECTFVENPLPRKRKLDDSKKPESKTSNPGAADSDAHNPSRRRASLTTTASTSNTTNNNSSSIAAAATAASPVEAHRHHREDTTPASKPAEATSATGLSDHNDSTLVGATTALDARIARLLTFNGSFLSSSHLGHVRRVAVDQHFLVQPTASAASQAAAAHDLAAVAAAVHPYAAFLANDLYLPFIHRNYPILNRHILLGDLARGRLPCSSPGLLLGVYMNALDWWAFRPGPELHAKPDARVLARLGRALAAQLGTRRSLSSVQAGLLLLQRPELHSWELVCRVVALGQEIGLHVACGGWALPAWERRLRRVCAWALFLQDKWAALTYGRPSHLRAADWAVEPLCAEDFAEEVDGEEEDGVESSSGGGGGDGADGGNATRPLNLNPPYGPDASDLRQVVFCQMVWLTEIVAEILDELYSQTAVSEFEAAANSGTGATRLILAKAKPLQMKLKAWFSALPQSTKMETGSESVTGAKASLHLAYFAAEITLHRRIISSLDPITTEAQLVYICRSAAKARFISAMEFVNRLRPDHLQSFWYFPSAANFALIGTFGSLLQVTAPAQEEADFYHARLQEYRWTLAVSSDRAPFLHATLGTLDALRDVLRDLAPKPPGAALAAAAAATTTMHHQHHGTASGAGGPPDLSLAAATTAGLDEADYPTGMAGIAGIAGLPPASTTAFSSDRGMSRFGSTPEAPSLDGGSTATSSAASVGYD